VICARATALSASPAVLLTRADRTVSAYAGRGVRASDEALLSLIQSRAAGTSTCSRTHGKAAAGAMSGAHVAQCRSDVALRKVTSVALCAPVIRRFRGRVRDARDGLSAGEGAAVARQS
jgi:hypothetical protein